LAAASASPPAEDAPSPAIEPPRPATPPDAQARHMRAEAIPPGQQPSAVTRGAISPRPVAPRSPQSALAQAEPPVNRERAAVGEVAGPVRVFVHIADPSQLPTAERIQSRLNRLRIADEPVATPPVRFVRGAPSRTEVRCLKHADCPAAQRVARYLAQTLGAPVAVVDMSATYERDQAVRDGSLELWLQPY
jgi:hypothetical protein